MIDFQDARQIVDGSLRTIARRNRFDRGERLLDIGIKTAAEWDDLIQTIVSNPTVGAPSRSIKVELVHFGALDTTVNTGALIDALQLSARKLCSNPRSPHGQPCCPYPKTCAECGWAVR
jgi:hypothetical protein